jgi:hypothetical protein
MKLSSAAVLALLAAAPALASASNFVVDFERNWDYTNGGVDAYYNGGSAADGSTGSNVGVSFAGVSGLSNDLDFTYYANAPTLQGVAYVFGPAFMNVAGGVDSALSFYYSSPEAIVGAVRAWSGLNGTGSLLGSFDLAANSSTLYDTWSNATFNFSGTALSFDLTPLTSIAALDNISAVPEPGSAALLLAGVAVIVGLKKGRRRA